MRCSRSVFNLRDAIRPTLLATFAHLLTRYNSQRLGNRRPPFQHLEQIPPTTTSHTRIIPVSARRDDSPDGNTHPAKAKLRNGVLSLRMARKHHMASSDKRLCSTRRLTRTLDVVLLRGIDHANQEHSRCSSENGRRYAIRRTDRRTMWF